MLVLGKLKWDVSAVTAYDFLEQIFSRLPLDQEPAEVLRKHAATFIALCCTGMLIRIRSSVSQPDSSLLPCTVRLLKLSRHLPV